MKMNGLNNRLRKLQITLLGSVLFFSWFFITVNDFFIFRDLSLQKYESTVKILSRNLTTCLSFNDSEECTRVLKTLQVEKDVEQAVVVDKNNNIVASFQRKDGPLKSYEMTIEDDSYQYTVSSRHILSTYPISENNVIEGRIYLLADFNMMAVFGKRHALVFLVIVLGSVIFGVFISRGLQRKISEQMNIILRFMRLIEKEKDYSLRISHSPDWKHIDTNEFQELGVSFDSMIEQVEKGDKSLKDLNANLEKIIDEKVSELVRTSELASLGEMAGGIAHEINNPLTIITSSNKVLVKLLGKETFEKEKFLEILKNIDSTVERIAKIIKGLRNISRKADDQDIAPCTFNDVFGDVFEVAEGKLRGNDVELRKTFSESDSQCVFNANRIQLSQALINLMNNSFDAIMENQDKDRWIQIKLSTANKKISLRVIDSGNGIPLHVREKMFNPFFTTKEIGKGTGIGLSLSKSMVEKMGGQFSYDDTCPNTCFLIQFNCQ